MIFIECYNGKDIKFYKEFKLRKRKSMVKKSVIAIMTICIVIFMILQSDVHAMDIGFIPDTYKPASTTDVAGADQIQNIANSIIGPIKVVGSAISVVALIIMGIKYVMGSIEEKAEYKKTMLPYLIGAIMVFAITNLLSILVEIVGGFK